MSTRTHYDNLHIEPTASAEEIRQAYRRLSKQYHPDLNQDPDAHRIMQLINQAYEILSNPETRAEHDRWIAAQRTQSHATTVQIIIPTHKTNTPTPTPPVSGSLKPKTKTSTVIAIIVATVLALGLLGWQITLLIQEKYPAQTVALQNTISQTNNSIPIQADTPASVVVPSPATPTQNNAPAASAHSSYIRPYAAPNGNPWPDESGYLTGYPIVQGQSNNRLYIDNVRNSSDVYAELTQAGQTQPLRHFFIKERGYIILDKLDAGAYTIRYRQLDAGEELLSEHVQIGGKAKEATIYLQRGKSPE